MEPSEYTPEFRTDVTVTMPDGRSSQVNPKYCLTKDNALQLAALLSGRLASMSITVSEGYPGVEDRRFGGGVTQSSKVAWLDFHDAADGTVGTRANAGLLADYFTHGYPPEYALKCALRDYEWSAYDQGFGPAPGRFQ